MLDILSLMTKSLTKHRSFNAPSPSYPPNLKGFHGTYTTAMIFDYAIKSATNQATFHGTSKPSYQCFVPRILKYTPPQWSLVMLSNLLPIKQPFTTNQSLAINVLFRDFWNTHHRNDLLIINQSLAINVLFRKFWNIHHRNDLSVTDQKPSYQCFISRFSKYTPPQRSLVTTKSLAINVLFRVFRNTHHRNDLWSKTKA